MALSMYQASIPVFVKTLGNLNAILDKAASFAEAKKVDPAVLFGTRLAPNMFPLSRQIQVASDTAKGAAARLAGAEPPSWEDREAGLAEFKARIERTIAFCKEFRPAQIDGSENRDITIKAGSRVLNFKGQPYLLHFALPNFFFHVTTAYDILRHCGVEIGKTDYLGQI
jgi:uncharacterized protein